MYWWKREKKFCGKENNVHFHGNVISIFLVAVAVICCSLFVLGNSDDETYHFNTLIKKTQSQIFKFKIGF